MTTKRKPIREPDLHTNRTRLTSRVDEESYTIVTNALPYGQITKVMDKFIRELARKIEEDKLMEIISWSYEKTDLTLKGGDK